MISRMEPGQASRTAVLVCQARAAADDRVALGRFADPFAAQLLRPDELLPVEQVREGASPEQAQQRLAYEAVRACVEVVVPRTVTIDDAVRTAAHDQVVIVGAGLDTRPWRLTALRDAAVYVVDLPASLDDRRERSRALEEGAERPSTLEYLALDLSREDLGEGLARTSHDPTAPTTWVWEGVVPYLTALQVESTVSTLASRSASGSTLVINYQAPSWRAGAGRTLMRVVARLTSAPDALAEEPWQSAWTPSRMQALLARHGFSLESDEDLLVLAQRLGTPTRHRLSLRTGRVAVAPTAG